MPFGIDQERWNTAKTETRAVLVERAKIKEPISYGDLVKRIDAVSFEARDQRLFALLGELSEEDAKAGKGITSALVVAAAEGMPGGGFFELAKKLKRKKADPVEMWIGELNLVYAAWKDT
jgi:hypothetical protein